YRRAAQAVGVARGRRAPGQYARNPGNSEPQHVGEIVPGVGHQRHGIGEHAVAELHRDERQVEADADGEGRAVVRGSVPIGASAMVMIIAFMHVSVAEGAMWAHGEHQSRRDAAGYMHFAALLHGSCLTVPACSCGLAATYQTESVSRVRLRGTRVPLWG